MILVLLVGRKNELCLLACEGYTPLTFVITRAFTMLMKPLVGYMILLNCKAMPRRIRGALARRSLLVNTLIVGTLLLRTILTSTSIKRILVQSAYGNIRNPYKKYPLLSSLGNLEIVKRHARRRDFLACGMKNKSHRQFFVLISLYGIITMVETLLSGGF